MPFECRQGRTLVGALFLAVADSPDPLWERETGVPDQPDAYASVTV